MLLKPFKKKNQFKLIYLVVNGHVSYWGMPPMSQPLVNKSSKPTASKSFTTLYHRNEPNGGPSLNLQGNMNSESQGNISLYQWFSTGPGAAAYKGAIR